MHRLYVENYPVAERYILTNNGCGESARDIYQDGFLAVWRNIQLKRFQPVTDGEFSAYLFRVVRNKWIDCLRKKHLTATVYFEDDATDEKCADTENELNEEDYIGLTVKHFHSLETKHKELLTCFYYHKQSMRDIAKHFGWTEATARNNKYRALQKLRALIAGDVSGASPVSAAKNIRLAAAKHPGRKMDNTYLQPEFTPEFRQFSQVKKRR